MPTDLSVPFYLSYVALWILVILQSLVLLGLLRLVNQLQRAGVSGNTVGTDASELQQLGHEAPTFDALDLSDRRISTADFAGREVAYLFVSPTCRACSATLQEIEALSSKAKGNVVIICRAGHKECVRLAETYELNLPVIVDDKELISQLFDVSSVPVAVLVDERNRIKSFGHPQRAEELDEMFETAHDMQPTG